jgi:hypothetical protein
LARSAIDIFQEVPEVDANLKSEIQEIIELVKQCPEPLQLRAFELLLQHALRNNGAERGEHADRGVGSPLETRGTKKLQGQDNDRQGESTLNVNELPMRVKAFMKKNSITPQQIEQLFHIEGGQIFPIWSLRTTKFAEGQMHIALMQSLKRALESGEFSFEQDEVRKEAREKRTYDDKNFSANFKYREAYFTKLAKDGLSPLSDDGMNALAALIRQLTASSDE